MPVLSSEVIAKTVEVLENVVLLLDDEIDERTQDPNQVPDDALPFKDALDCIRAAIPKLQAARVSMVATETLQPDLWLTDGE